MAAVAVEMILDLRSERMAVTTCHHEHSVGDSHFLNSKRFHIDFTW